MLETDLEIENGPSITKLVLRVKEGVYAHLQSTLCLTSASGALSTMHSILSVLAKRIMEKEGADSWE